MAKTSNYWDKRALKRLTEAEKHSEVYIKRVKSVYEQAYKDIDRELASIYKNYSKETGLDTQKLKELLTRSETKKTWEKMKRQGLDKYIKENYKARISRAEQLQAQIYAKAKSIYPKEELQNTMCYKGVINQSYYKTMYDTQMGTGYAFNFATIDNNMIDALLQDPWSGANYSQRIWGNTDILADSLSQILGGAMLSGQGIEKTAKQIRDRFNVSEYYAERLIRTETNHFNNEVDAMAYEEMGLDKYVFVATLDSRTSEICQLMDNKVFKYSEREEGVNYPPLHPNCRSKTRAYLGAEEEKDLQRRARNPITGKTELISNMSYKDWIKQYAQTNRDVQQPTKTVVNASKSVKNEPKTTKNWLKTDNLPAWFKDYNGKIDEEGILLTEWLNKNGNPNSKASKVYSKSIKDLGKRDTNFDKKFVNMQYKEGKGSFVRDRYSNDIIAPKLTNKDNPTGSIQTMLHENWHAIDYYKHNNGKFLSNTSDTLKKVVYDDDNKIGKDVSKLFEDFNKQCGDIANRVSKDNHYLFEEINKKWSEGKYKSYRSYTSAWSKARSKIKELIDYEERNLMGGGVNNLQDIYDGLSAGYFKDSGTVKYGHGRKYFRKGGVDSQVREIVANYGALSMTRPDLIAMLKADKPQLVKELEALMDSMM